VTQGSWRAAKRETGGSRTCAGHESKIGRNQLVRSFATALIDLGGNFINQVAVQIEGRRTPFSSNCMLGVTRLKASSVTKNDASKAPSCPQNRTAHRVASNERLGFGNLSAMV